MKKFAYQLIDKLFDLTNKKIAERVLMHAVSELTSYPGTTRITLTSLCRMIAIRSQQHLTDKQLMYLIKLLPHPLSERGYRLQIEGDHMWVTKQTGGRNYAH